MFKIFVLCPIFLNQKAASFSIIFLWFEASVLTSNFISSLKISDAVLEMDSIVQRLCPLCQEVTDEPLKCPGNSKDVKQISQTYINRKTLLKQFQTGGRVPRNFHYALQAFPFFRLPFQAKYSISKTQNGILQTMFILLKQNC